MKTADGNSAYSKFLFCVASATGGACFGVSMFSWAFTNTQPDWQLLSLSAVSFAVAYYWYKRM